MMEHALTEPTSGLQRTRGDGVAMALFGGISLFLLLVGLVTVAVSTRHWPGLNGLAVGWTRIALFACAAALPLGARSPDLSLAGVAAVGGVVFGAVGGLPGLFVGAVVGAALGAGNGALAGLLRLHPAICTLASGVGLTTVAIAAVTVTDGLETMRLSTWVPASVLALVCLAAAATDGVALFARPWPRRWESAHRFSMHVIAGVLAGLAGAVGVSQLGVVTPGTLSTGHTVLVAALAAAVLGGTSAAGGRRCLLGAVFAAGFLAMLFSLAAVLGVSTIIVDLVYVVVLVLALGADRVYEAYRRRPVPHSTGIDATTLPP